MELGRILVVDDDEAIADIIATYLKREGMEVHQAGDGLMALEAARRGGWDLIVLDVMLPRLDGFEILRRLRSEGVDIPILFLTARGEEVDQVLGLGLGADDYVVKPFSGAALVARVKAHLRRYRELKGQAEVAGIGGVGTAAPGQTADRESALLRFPGLEIDPQACTVRREGQEVTLTAREFELLRFLAQHPGRVFTREQIYRNVWGEEFLGDDNTVMVHIRRLREKIEPDPSRPRYLVTVRGLGYRFTGGK